MRQRKEVAMYVSTIKRAEKIQSIVKEHYEPGRQDRCKLWVYRTYIFKMFGISQRTFFYYLSLDTQRKQSRPAAIQLSLF